MLKLTPLSTIVQLYRFLNNISISLNTIHFQFIQINKTLYYLTIKLLLLLLLYWVHWILDISI